MVQVVFDAPVPAHPPPQPLGADLVSRDRGHRIGGLGAPSPHTGRILSPAGSLYRLGGVGEVDDCSDRRGLGYADGDFPAGPLALPVVGGEFLLRQAGQLVVQPRLIALDGEQIVDPRWHRSGTEPQTVGT